MSQIWVDVDDCDDLSDETLDEMINSYISKITKGKRKPKNHIPQLIIAMGAPGAGKSTLANKFANIYFPNDDFVEHDYDNVIETCDPDYNLLIDVVSGDKSSVRWIYAHDKCNSIIMERGGRKVINVLMNGGYNVILQTHSYLEIIDFQTAGYQVHILYVMANNNISAERAAKRAIRTGRFASNATKENSWGWSSIINRSSRWYSYMIPWIATWCDTISVVTNDVDNYEHTEKDFKQYDLHPENEDASYWKTYIAELYSVIRSKKEGEHINIDKIKMIMSAEKNKLKLTS